MGLSKSVERSEKMAKKTLGKQNRKWWFKLLKRLMVGRYKRPEFVYLGEKFGKGGIILSNHEGTDAPLTLGSPTRLARSVPALMLERSIFTRTSFSPILGISTSKISVTIGAVKTICFIKNLRCFLQYNTLTERLQYAIL